MKKRIVIGIFIVSLIIIALCFIIYKIIENSTNSVVIKNENYYNNLFCNSIGGNRETRHYYSTSYVIADCETDEYIIEGGLDKRRSLDSIQQAVFFSILSNKKPMVVIYNTDEEIGKYELQIQAVANELGIRFEIKTFTENLTDLKK